jgi:hypothetical protein
VKEQIKSIAAYAALLVAIFACFRLYKMYNRVVIEAADHSMQPQYPPGAYWLESPPDRAKEIPLNEAVAYEHPGKSEGCAVAWVVAREGQVVEIRDKEIWVDGALALRQPKGIAEDASGFMVPRGCVYLVANVSGEASQRYGPLPLRCVRGLLK